MGIRTVKLQPFPSLSWTSHRFCYAAGNTNLHWRPSAKRLACLIAVSSQQTLPGRCYFYFLLRDKEMVTCRNSVTYARSQLVSGRAAAAVKVLLVRKVLVTTVLPHSEPTLETYCVCVLLHSFPAQSGREHTLLCARAQNPSPQPLPYQDSWVTEGRF